MDNVRDDLLEQAGFVLKQNDRGAWMVPSGELYPHQWLWDSCFIAIGLRHINVERAKQELESLTRGQWANGMLPDMIFAQTKRHPNLDEVLWDSAVSPFAPAGVATSGITQPPMLSEAILKVGEKMKLPERRGWYKKMLPSVIKFHQWLYDERDPGNEGLVTLLHPYESGMDNSPPWVDELHARGIPWWVKLADKLPLDWLIDLIRRDTRRAPPKQRMSNIEALSFWVALRRLRRKAYDSRAVLAKPYLAIQDFGYNAILVRSNHALIEIAKIAGSQVPRKLLDQMKRSDDALEILWEESSSQYFSRSFSRGQLIHESTSATFLALYAGTISDERAKKLVELLGKRSTFKPAWPVPSVPLNSNYFDTVKYWQGPVWVNMNWLIIEGLKNYGFDEQAEALRDKTLQMVAKSGFREYFNPRTGDGLGAKNFSWTAALTIDLLKD